MASARRSLRSAAGCADWAGSLCGEMIRKLGEGVPCGIERLAVDHAAVGRDARRAQSLERALEPPVGSRSPRVLVDDVALARPRDGADDGDPDLARAGALLQRVDQLRARHRLVGYDQDLSQW